MKLNYLSRLTALLLALIMMGTYALADDGTSLGDLTINTLDTTETANDLISQDYCETCAKDVASAGLTEWPVTGDDCLYKHLAALTPSEAYAMLITFYNANT